MKKVVLLIFFIASFSLGTQAKKNKEAWKQEKNLEQQYTVFKKNLNFWNGNYFLSNEQLDAFHGAMLDTIKHLEGLVATGTAKINQQQQELKAKQKQVDETQLKCKEATRLKNSIRIFGMNVNKNIYSITMYLLILAALAIAGFVFMLFRRSSRITHQTKEEYEALKQEYETHKKNALERYTKINMELHRTRLELKKK